MQYMSMSDNSYTNYNGITMIKLLLDQYIKPNFSHIFVSCWSVRLGKLNSWEIWGEKQGVPEMRLLIMWFQEIKKGPWPYMGSSYLKQNDKYKI